jgi:hypothetical protein
VLQRRWSVKSRHEWMWAVPVRRVKGYNVRGHLHRMYVKAGGTPSLTTTDTSLGEQNDQVEENR